VLCLFLLCAFAVVVVDILTFDVRGEANTICLGCWSRPAGWGFIIYLFDVLVVVLCAFAVVVVDILTFDVRGEADTICLCWSRPAGWGFIIYFCLMFWWLSMCMMCTILALLLLLLYLAGRACRTLIVDALVLIVLCCKIRWTLLFDVSSIVMGLPNNWCPWHLKTIYCVRAGHSLFIVNVLTKTVLCCHVLICRCRTLLFDVSLTVMGLPNRWRPWCLNSIYLVSVSAAPALPNLIDH